MTQFLSMEMNGFSLLMINNLFPETFQENRMNRPVISGINKKSDVKVKKENILITNGATNAIFLLSYFFKNLIDE